MSISDVLSILAQAILVEVSHPKASPDILLHSAHVQNSQYRNDYTPVVSNRDLVIRVAQFRRQGRWPEALRIFESCRRTMQLNMISYSAAISACEKGKRWELAFQLLEECKTWATVNTISYNAAISACEKCAE